MERVRSVRGATTVEGNFPAAMSEAVTELMAILLTVNRLDPADVVMVLFTCTSDLNCCFPSQVLRTGFQGWDQVPLLDFAQLPVVGSLPLCVRVVLQVYSHERLQPVYLRGARHLRPDLCEERG